MLDTVSTQPGSYALRLVLSGPLRLQIGRLGIMDLPAGDYFYLGSAHGPGGLRARLRHHFRMTSQPHWHLDWLRPWCQLAGGWVCVGTGNLECAWSSALAHLPGAQIPAPGFGAADCQFHCPAHLVAFTDGFNLKVVEAALGECCARSFCSIEMLPALR